MLIYYVLLLRLAGATLMEEIRGEWRLELRPRLIADNIQPFEGALGDLEASAISSSGDAERPYEVEGDTFPDFQSAASRACDRQKNACADAANNGDGEFEVSDCDSQRGKCMDAAATATETKFQALVSSDDTFDYFCDV